MNITKAQTGELTATIQINLQNSDFESDVNKSLRDYQRKATVPGFRPGKVPFGLVKKMYGSSVMADQVNKTISKALNDYLVDEKLSILGHPIANIDKTGTIDFDHDSDFNFFFDIGIAPEFDVNLESIELEYSKIIAGDKQIEETINNMLERNPIHIHPEIVSENDDIEANITEVDENGKEKEDGFVTELSFKMSNITDKESKATLIGKTDGAEFIINLEKAFGGIDALKNALKWPEDKLIAPPSNYNLVIKEIHHEEKANLDEEFFEKIFPNQNINTIDDFKFKVAEDINKQLEGESDRYFAGKAIDSLVEQIKFSLPEEFMKAWVLQNAEGKITKEKIDEDYVQYDRTFRWQLIEGKLIDANPLLAVSREEIRNAVKQQFFGQFMSTQVVDEEMNNRMEPIVDMILKNQDEARKISDRIAESKFGMYIKENAKITVKEISYDTFIESFNQNEIVDHE
jgi:trigger factor